MAKSPRAGRKPASASTAESAGESAGASTGPSAGAAAAAPVDIAARREAVLDAAMALAAARGWRRVALADIAAESGLSLSELYDAFPSKGAILSFMGSRIDAKVLAGTGADMAEEGKRDRLFDVLMRRFDAVSPYRQGLRALLAESRRDPGLALAAAPRLLRSMAWSLEAAGIRTSGIAGALRVKALAALYLSVMRVWVDDESPDMAGTMAALDGRLRRAERFLGA